MGEYADYSIERDFENHIRSLEGFSNEFGYEDDIDGYTITGKSEKRPIFVKKEYDYTYHTWDYEDIKLNIKNVMFKSKKSILYKWEDFYIWLPISKIGVRTKKTHIMIIDGYFVENAWQLKGKFNKTLQKKYKLVNKKEGIALEIDNGI